METLRADAQRNLGLVLDAAAEAFAESGPDVSVDEIARRAGVGHATVFRRFPTKGSLIAAVAQARLSELIALAQAALAEDDAGAAFHGFVWRVAELHAHSRGLYECFDRCLGAAESVELREVVARLVERAQAAGSVRSDFGAEDVSTLVGAAIRSAPPEQWRRYVGVVLDGLRPPAR
ncbi:MAG TPA: helix-turn-helix domain-containing protein [Gaiellaceae bacterium]|jgi:AcrR family transcriptional regulator|nr:helix-turn-helix domain-containing protein [Gaiellaceae bacterium]